VTVDDVVDFLLPTASRKKRRKRLTLRPPDSGNNHRTV
jgi:hypothetical protein